MITFLRGNACALLLLGALGAAPASADSTAPAYDVTLTSWQYNTATGQENFSLNGPGVSLTGSGYDEDFGPPSSYFPRYEEGYYGRGFRVSNTHGGTFAQGMIDGVTFTANNPLGLYGSGPYLMTPPFFLAGTDPLLSFPVSLSGSPPGDLPLAGCTPDCLTTLGANYYFDFLPASGTVQLQFTGSEDDGGYTLTSFSFTASPTPEPASYASLAFGLLILFLAFRILPKRRRQQA